MGSFLDQVNNLTAEQTSQAIEESSPQNPAVPQNNEEIERGAWDNLFVSMERSFYNIVDLGATSVRKLSTLTLDDEDVRKQVGAGWIGKNAGKIADTASWAARDPNLAPETDPETMDKFAELLGTTVPYTAAAMAGAAVGFAAGGPVGAGAGAAKVGAALTSFSIMREDAYRGAIDTGADEQTANIEANIVGGIQALLEMAQIGGILKQSKTGGVLLKSITLNARNKAWTQVLKAGGKLSMNMVRTMTEEALQEALQGTTGELVPKLLRDKEIEPGFWGRRGREAAGGAIIGGLFGGIGSLAEIAVGKGEAATIPSRPEIEGMSLEDPTVEQQAAGEFESAGMENQKREQEVTIINKYLAEHDASKGTVPASKPFLPTRDEAFAKRFNAEGGGAEGRIHPDGSLVSDLIHAEDAIRIGERLGYHPNDIAAFLENSYGKNIITEQTSDIPSERDIEFSEEVVEGETASPAQKADAVVEGAEVEPVVEEMGEPDTRTDSEKSIDKLNEALEKRVSLKEIHKLTEEERSQELGRRVGEAEIVEKRLIEEEEYSIDEAHGIAMKELAGVMPKAVLPAITADEMTPIDFENVRKAILDKGLRFFERTHAFSALNKLQDGMVPTKSEMRELGKVIGEEKVEAMIEAMRGFKDKAASFVLNLINFPTTSLAGSDISFVGRQGLLALVKWPEQWVAGLRTSYKAFFSPEWAEMMQNDLQTRSTHELRQNSNVKFYELDSTNRTKTEERFQSEWAKRIPFYGALVRASERASVVGMNQLSADIFDYVADSWKGMNYPTIEYNRLGQIANLAVGRANINNKKVQAILPYLNVAFFSPQYGGSRFEFLGRSVNALFHVVAEKAGVSAGGKKIVAGPAQKVIASQLVNMLVAGGLAMTIASMLGAKVERDPRSSDYGKIQLGRMRIDVWAGFQQIARSTAQIVTGQGKAISSEEIFSKNRLETFGRFIQGKLSPAAGLMVELASGKTFLGEPIPEFRDNAEFMQWAIYQKLAPLVIQDTIDAFQYSQNKAATALALPLAFHGIGVQTFETNSLDDLSQMRNQYSTEVFGKDWDNIGPLSQKALRLYKPQIAEQEKISSFERRNAVFDVKRQREAGVTVEKSLSRDVRDEMDDLSITLGGLSRTITRNWRLNGSLYKKYQTDLSNILNRILPQIVSNPAYQALPPQMRQRIMEKIITQSKAAIRKSIVMTANINDLEDVRRGVEDD